MSDISLEELDAELADLAPKKRKNLIFPARKNG